MTNFLLISHFLIVSLVFSIEAEECDSAERKTCLTVIDGIRDNARLAVNLGDEGVISKLCIQFPQCMPHLKCGSDKEVKAIVDKMEVFCEIMVFRNTPEFADCDSKLDPKKSECIKEWNPFPSLGKAGSKSKEMREIQGEACKNFFGKNNCMEKEIKDRCGSDMWPRLKKHYLAMNKLNDVCHFQ